MIDKPKIEVRSATRSDVMAFYGEMPPQTIRAQVAAMDGEVVGIAGVIPTGRGLFVFSDAKEDLKQKKVTLWRLSKKFMEYLDRPAWCTAEDGAEAFLVRLGWSRSIDEDGVFTWQP